MSGGYFLLLVADATLYLATFSPQVQSCQYFGQGLQNFFGLPQPPSLVPCSLTTNDTTLTSTMEFGFSSANLGQNYSAAMTQLLLQDPSATNLTQSLSRMQPVAISLRTLKVVQSAASPGSPSSSMGTAEIIVIAAGAAVLVTLVIGCIAMRAKAKENERLREAMTAMNAPMEDRMGAGGNTGGSPPAPGRKATGTKRGAGYVPPQMKEAPETAAVAVAPTPTTPASPPPTPVAAGDNVQPQREDQA